MLALFLVAAWSIHRGARQRWARQQALPEIERLLDSSPGSGDLTRWHAFQLGREAERWLPGDPLLDRLRERYSGPVTVHSDPPGAHVLAQPYWVEGKDWEQLGVTPIDDLDFTSGVLRLTIEKDGYEPVDDLYWNPRFASVDPGYILRPKGEVQAGMVWAPATAPQLRVAGAPAGIHMPGVEHLPPQEVGDFSIDRHEVTNAEFQRFVDAGGYTSAEVLAPAVRR